MRYLVCVKPHQETEIAPYIRKKIERNWAIIEVEDQEIEKVKESVEAIEPDFKIKLEHTFWYDLGILTNEPVMVVTIGKYCLCHEMQYTYALDSHKWEEQSPRKKQAIWIHGYSQSEIIHSSDWLEAIRQFERLSKMLHYPLIIVQNMKSVLPYFSASSLAQTYIEDYLKTSSSLFIRQNWNSKEAQDPTQSFHIPNNNLLETQASAYKLQKIIQLWLQNQRNGKKLKKGEKPYLYSDVFYTQIPPEQKIYVPLYQEMSLNEQLEIHTVNITQHPVIYEKRKVLEQYGKTLRACVLPYLEQPIMTRVPIKRTSRMGEIMQKQDKENLKLDYKGKGVYIGIITEEAINYHHEDLKKDNHTTRISGYWVQEEGEKGRYYIAADLNAQIKAKQAMPIQSEEQMVNDIEALLIEVGGKGEAYEGIAKEAEFLVAQIQKAPKTLQEIYTGKISEKAVLMAEVLIAAEKLMQRARLDDRPLVLIIPYQMNLSTHDGAGFYENRLSTLGKQPGCTIIMPVGEEGDKKHHLSFESHSSTKPFIELESLKDGAQIAGILYFKHIPRTFFKNRIECYRAFHEKQAIALNESAEYRLEECTIYTTGLIDYDRNGMLMIHFVIKNMPRGKWYIKGLPEILYEDARIEFYLSEEEGNTYVTCLNAMPFKTMSATAALEGVMAIGGYDEENSVSLSTCGKGDQERGGMKPFCVANGKLRNLDIMGRVCEIEGSMVAVSEMAGVVAALYEKGMREEIRPYPNTLWMKQYLLNSLKIEPERKYPDATQGYGILSLERLAYLATSHN